MEVKKDLVKLNIAEEECMGRDTFWMRIKEFKCFNEEEGRQQNYMNRREEELKQ